MLGLLIQLVRLALEKPLEHKAAEEHAAVRRITGDLADALRRRDWERFDAVVADAVNVAPNLPRTDAARLRASTAQFRAEANLVRGRLEDAIEQIVAAARSAEGLPGSEAHEARLEACGFALIASAFGEPTPDIARLADEGIRRSGEIAGPRARSRIAEGAHLVGGKLRELGQRDEAARMFERAVALAEGHPWSATRNLGVRAGLDRIALLPRDADEIDRWFERLDRLVHPPVDANDHESVAGLLVARASRPVKDALMETPARLALLERAREAGRQSATPAGLRLATVATLRLAEAAEEAGEHRAARASYDEVIAALEPSHDAEAELMRTRALLGGALARCETEDVECMAWLDRAMQAGLEHPEQGLHVLAFRCGVTLANMLAGLGMAKREDEVLARLEAALPGLPDAARPAASVALELERARRARGHGDLDGAELHFRRALADASGLQGEEDVRSAWRARLGLVILRMEAGRWSEARDLLRAHLDEAGIAGASNSAELAAVRLHLGICLGEMDDEPGARSELRQAFDAGRTSGGATGRMLAAHAARRLAEKEAPGASRSGWLDRAADLARLVGTPEAERFLAGIAGMRGREQGRA